MNALLQRARGLESDLIELRRDLHRHPELSFRETRTAATAASRAEALGYEVRREIGRTGVIAELRNGAGPTVALRADMDALPIHEENDVVYRSTAAGVMHACGHDAHVSMLIGAAHLLVESREEGELPAGTVRLLFQPSEEAADDQNMSGAARMVEDGAMDGVDAVFGLHIGAHLEAGVLRMGEGPQMGGSDSFTVTIRGRGSHAARPHQGTDAVVLASHFVLACQQTVSRRVSPLSAGVLTIGRIEGGVAENVVASDVVLHGTVRYFDDDVRRTLHEGLRDSLAAVEALGARGELDLREGYPPVVNDPAMTALAREAAVDTLGAERVADGAPTLGAEDFALLQREAPGCFFWLGAALDPPREHHHPEFDIDESVLVLGASALAACASHALDTLNS